MTTRAAALFVAFSLLPASCLAATFCASTSTQLRDALSTAASNGEADDIRLTRTTFSGSSTAPFQLYLGEAHGVRISGGWSLLGATCWMQTFDATRTVLDGGLSAPALRILVTSTHAVVPVTVEGLTLRNGYSFSSEASGLSVTGIADGAASIVVDRVIVHSNASGQDNIPAVYLTSDDSFVRFSNSIVRHNTTLDAPAIFVLSNAGGTAMHNLSVLYNTRQGLGESIEVLGIGPSQISNSLFFGTSGGGDLGGNGIVRYYNVRYGTGGDPVLLNQQGFNNYVITDPKLQSPTTPRPLFDSPLRNVGGNTVATREAFGQPRILGGYADVGALEYVE
jgi:hypothetical protein